ncbi:protein REDOX 2-like isoform X1 [Gastrolobium bilobum]|uniref:protein REDOX 2-like isoform X1 n=1 Tax=Gastrolobium bilobum TaxID=150636 RepID=UPI002AB06A3E|nr:protein REDOX 2-like isoform X1 [Gastrolobium bilobum]
MEVKKIPEVILCSGQKMPLIGMGTAPNPLTPQEALISIFIDGFDVGYRHFDTASLYGSEEPLGKAVAKALELGLIKGRDEVFITSKLWCTDAQHDLVLPALKTTLQLSITLFPSLLISLFVIFLWMMLVFYVSLKLFRKLRLEYVDLYLIHWPLRLRPGVELINISEEDVFPLDMKGTWEAMEECYRLGLAKSIGVSNFGIKKLNQLLENATVLPAVNQVEMNPSWQQGKLREFCKQEGIHVSAWSPLGAYKTSWGSNAVMENPILMEIARARQKSVAQVALRWIYEQRTSPIAKSFNKERMKQNLEIFDWELSQEELQKLSQIPQRRTVTGEQFVSENGPFKSLEELWDGEP